MYFSVYFIQFFLELTIPLQRRYVVIKILINRSSVSSTGTMVERETTSKLPKISEDCTDVVFIFPSASVFNCWNNSQNNSAMSYVAEIMTLLNSAVSYDRPKLIHETRFEQI